MPNKIKITEMEFENLPWKVETLTSYGALMKTRDHSLYFYQLP